MGRLTDELRRNSNICIYGCGECGIQTYLLLREAGVNIDCFGDKDNSKAGYVVDGVFCKTYNEILLMDKKNFLLIVAIAQGEKLVDDFRRLGFAKVFYYGDVKRELYADLQKRYSDSKSLGIDALRELKQYIEELAYQNDLPIEKKRDAVLRRVLEIQEEESNETSAG